MSGADTAATLILVALALVAFFGVLGWRARRTGQAAGGGGFSQIAAAVQGGNDAFAWVDSLPDASAGQGRTTAAPAAAAASVIEDLAEPGGSSRIVTAAAAAPKQPKAARPPRRFGQPARERVPMHDGALAWARAWTAQARATQDAAPACREVGMVSLAAGCKCPALYAGAVCVYNDSQSIEQGTCACGPALRKTNTRPYARRAGDGVLEAVPYELEGNDGVPRAYAGPLMLSRAELRTLKASVPKGSAVARVLFPGKDQPTELISAELYSPLLEALPERDPLQNLHGAPTVYPTCAVVGNGGSLLLGQRGSEIDGHAFVIRFNGAPTLGFERYVGGKTNLRLVNSHWTDFEERLSHMPLVATNPRNPKEVRNHVQRFAAAKKDASRQLNRELKRGADEEGAKAIADAAVNGLLGQRALLSPEFAAYAAQAVQEMHLYHTSSESRDDTPMTPTGGLTGILLALSMCEQVSLYGMHVSEPSGVPYHFHNRCPQPYSERDEAEYQVLRHLALRGVVQFREPCVHECVLSLNDTLAALGESQDPPERFQQCVKCREMNLSSADRSAGRVARMRWEAGPMPSYCDERARELRMKKERGECMGVCGAHFHWWDDHHVAAERHAAVPPTAVHDEAGAKAEETLTPTTTNARPLAATRVARPVAAGPATAGSAAWRPVVPSMTKAARSLPTTGSPSSAWATMPRP